MGTGVSLDIPTAGEKTFDSVFNRLKQIDRKFSPYKKTSELSSYNRGELKEADLSREMKFILHACRRAEERTDGYFNSWYSGRFEPSGYVKGWAIAEAAKLIKAGGYNTYCIFIGGDILASSTSEKTWKIALQNPFEKAKILNTLSISNGAVATSGNYERGMHIFNPKNSRPANALASLSVTGPDIVWSDVLATAGFAAGLDWKNILEKFRGYEALAVSPVGHIEQTQGF